ncbi:MAG: apolipoprotein acyltransferase [Planctomycetota bacterium]|nr:MAG: apolipoprotein acyltransferase [Planctomycetota bacterium]
MGRELVVGLVQMRCTDDPQANLDKALEYVELAATEGVQVVCLQELFRTLYFCEREDHDAFALAEPVPGPSTEVLGAAARRHGMVIVGSVFERRAPGLYHNTAVVLDADGRLCGLYRKMHIPDDPGYYEKFYFAPGDLGFRAFRTRHADLGVCVCWDQWFPEAARLTALAGAELLLYPTAIGHHREQPEAEWRAEAEAWEISMRGHAVANGIYVAAANRTGMEGDKCFWGRSFVADPLGAVLERASEDEEELLVCALDLDRIERVRQQWPFLRDRRIDAYGALGQRYLGLPAGPHEPGRAAAS